MADESNTPEPETPPEDSKIDEPTLDDVLKVETADLTDDQKTFLEKNKGELTDEQLDQYGLEKSEERELDPEKIKVKVRDKPAPVKKAEPTGKDDDEVDPEDRKTISKIVSEQTADLRSDNRRIKDEGRIDEFIRANPDSKKWRGVALKYAKSPSWQNVPVTAIFSYLMRDEALSDGARRERAAQKKADETKSGGSSVRKPGGGKTDWARATPEQIEEEKNRIFGRQV